MAMTSTYASSAPARAEIDALEGPAVIAFGAPWCGYCQAAQPALAAALHEYPRVQQLVPFALAFGDRRAGALDVGPGPRVAAVEKEHPRPDVDRELVLTVEIVVESGEEQLLDSRVGAFRVAKRIRHQDGPIYISRPVNYE